MVKINTILQHQWHPITIMTTTTTTIDFITTFSIIASILWYFMMSVAILTSLTYRQTVIHERGSLTKYQIFVVSVSFIISLFQIIIDVSAKDLKFVGGYVETFYFFFF